MEIGNDVSSRRKHMKESRGRKRGEGKPGPKKGNLLNSSAEIFSYKIETHRPLSSQTFCLPGKEVKFNKYKIYSSKYPTKYLRYSESVDVQGHGIGKKTKNTKNKKLAANLPRQEMFSINLAANHNLSNFINNKESHIHTH